MQIVKFTRNRECETLTEKSWRGKKYSHGVQHYKITGRVVAHVFITRNGKEQPEGKSVNRGLVK